MCSPPPFLRLSALLFLVLITLFCRPTSPSSIWPAADQQHQQQASFRDVPTLLLDRSAIMSEERDYPDVGEEEEETTSISIEMNGKEARAEERHLMGGHNGTNERMDGVGVNLVEELSSPSSGRTTTPVATDASNSIEQQQQFPAQQKATTLTALTPSKVHLPSPNKRRKSGKKEFVAMEYTSDASAASSIVPANGPTPPAPPTAQQKRHQFRGLNANRHSKTAARTFASGRYEPPAQRPPMVPRMPSRQPDDSSDLLAPKRFLPSPQAPFRSPAGHQYAPLWSPDGAAFVVPSSPAAHVGGIAYYAPNSDGHGEEADAANSAVRYEQKKAPVLLIGAFPPSAKVRPFLSPSSAFSSQYSPPNAPLAGKYYPPATSPPPQTFPNKIPSKLSEFATQTQRNIPAEFAEIPPISLRFPPQSETTAAPTMPPAYSRLPPHFPTLTSAQPAEFTVPPPLSGHFIPGRPYQLNRSGGSSTTTAPAVPKNECDEPDILPPASSLPQPTEAPRAPVPNRAVGRARIICKENGMEFALRTVFPFTGQIFAHDKKRIAGRRDRFATAMEQFHVQIVVGIEIVTIIVTTVMFQQQNGTSNVQSFFVQCGQQNIAQREKHPPMARHIEEALEELHIVPIELEQKAPLPIPTMRFLLDVHGGADGAEVDGQLQIGQSLRVEFALQPETEAFGFLVRNCVVRDAVRGVEHEVIDRWGCSTDLNIFGHLRYDNFRDIARAHWHAFKLPDQAQLSLKCRIVVCTDLRDPDDQNGLTSCASLPSPPFCPDLVTSPSDSVLADLSSSFARRRRRNAAVSVVGVQLPASEQRVRTSLCFGDADGDENYPNSSKFCRSNVAEHLHSLGPSDKGIFYLSLTSLAALSAFCFVFVLIALAGNLLLFRCTRRDFGRPMNKERLDEQ
uniref:ZP domain-containing protein n=1 Tax=Globodera rostochiensis TaxID=31243 RepID=A0A914I9N6_GLORO